MPKSSPKKYSVSIVIPNWNGKHLLAKHLSYVIAAAPDAEIIVTDDASTDGSVEFVQSIYPAVRVLPHASQRGFAGNVDSGVSIATGDIVVLLNTDVRPEKDFLKPLLASFDDPSVAAVGCLEKSFDPEGVVYRGRGIARWEKGYFIHARGEVNVSDTAWVSGGSCAYRRSVWNELGGMDPIYNPFYWEDIDLSYRALKAGYRILFEKHSVVGHYHEEGKIKTSYSPQDVKRIVYRNQFIFIWKNLSDPAIWMAHIFWTPVRLLQAIASGNALMIVGYVLAVSRLPAVLSSRMRAAKHWKKSDRSVLPAFLTS